MTLTGDASESSLVLAEVFRSVLAHVGVKGEASERLLDQVMNERRKAAVPDCKVHFIAHAGEIEIWLSHDGSTFRTSCPVPIR